MQKFIVEGGRRLSGDLTLQGAKNSILPLSAAALLCADSGESRSAFVNCPEISDVYTCARIISALGGKCFYDKGTLTVDAQGAGKTEIPDALMREMRSSIIFLGAVVAVNGRCRLVFPGGCKLGARPIDMHIMALRRMGAVIKEEYGFIECTADKGLHGAEITLPFPSVGATENIILAGAMAQGETVIINAAREPEIVDLCTYLNRCGAKISGAGGSTIRLEGVGKLSGQTYEVMPDRIAAATYLCAAAATGGEILLLKCRPEDLRAVIPILEQAGCYVRCFGTSVYLSVRGGKMKSADTVRTMPYPGFPTDMQPALMASMCRAEGSTVFVENIFENRYNHVPELRRMGADISVEGKVCVVRGVHRLHGAEVEAPDLRGGAALVTAGLSAEGTTIISGVGYIDRGYDSMEKALCGLGAAVRRV